MFGQKYKFEGNSNEKYSEIILSKKKKKGRAEEVDSASKQGIKYNCRECGGIEFHIEYNEIKFRKIPNPEIFGKNAEQINDSRIEDKKYFCNNCGSSSSKLEIIATCEVMN